MEASIPMITLLKHAAGEARLEPGAGSSRLTVRLNDAHAASPRLTIDTTYPADLIARILEVKGPAYLCDEIARDQDPGYVEDRLLRTLRAYISPPDLAGKRILDFGCGSGASTMTLARAFRESRITGVELDPALISVAAARARFYGFDRVEFLTSPSGVELPPALGTVDVIVMSAVIEHLLPEERRRVMPMLWRALAPGGWIFIDETPHRLHHVEGHTTGLWLLNYLPDKLAHAMARRFCAPYQSASWDQLLRDGVRGATEREVLRSFTIPGEEGRPVNAEPSLPVPCDRLDLHFSIYNGEGRRTLGQRVHLAVLKAIKHLTGVTYTRSLSMAIRKAA
jgi:2-polyprenyl-3-methyl-5-hydroxy-6-metoxy-1,4-benzoquinol methylase